jgi:hypothetical protein
MKAYKIKLEVKNSHPPVWRRAMIPVALTFHQLNIVLNKILELDKKDRGLFEFYHINIRICEKPDRNIDGGYAYYDSKMTLIEAYFDSQNWFTFKNKDVAWRVTIEEVVNDYKYDYPRILEDKPGASTKNPLDEKGIGKLNRYLRKNPMEKIEFENETGDFWEVADIDAWRELYKYAVIISEQKPWEKADKLGFYFLDHSDIPGKEDTFISILGSDKDAIVLAFYEGVEAFNKLFMLPEMKKLNIPEAYAIGEQEAMYLSFGSRTDIDNEQYEVIKELGYRFRGKNHWIYFSKAKPGFFPMILNKHEVEKMTTYLKELTEGLQQFEKQSIEFKEHNMLYINPREGKVEPSNLPFTTYQYMPLKSNDRKLKFALRSVPESNDEVEADIRYINAQVDDDRYPVPINPRICMIADSYGGELFDFSIAGPDDDSGVMLLDILIDFIFKKGRPKTLYVSSEIVGSMVKEICDICKINLIYKKRLKVIDRQMNF